MHLNKLAVKLERMYRQLEGKPNVVSFRHELKGTTSVWHACIGGENASAPTVDAVMLSLFNSVRAKLEVSFKTHKGTADAIAEVLSDAEETK